MAVIVDLTDRLAIMKREGKRMVDRELSAKSKYFKQPEVRGCAIRIVPGRDGAGCELRYCRGASHVLPQSRTLRVRRSASKCLDAKDTCAKISVNAPPDGLPGHCAYE